jgi:SOS response regulatory protein OraA/RecX
MELNAKRVDSILISNALGVYETWLENAQKELKKKFKDQKPTDYQSKMKQKQFLFMRGFSASIIDKVL